MKNYTVTMVNPQQIVSKGLQGCNSTRTVTAFAQKYGVPCVWWTPNKSQKVLLVDWPQFRTTWNQVWSGQWTWPTNYKGTNYTGGGFTTNYGTTSYTKNTGNTGGTKTKRMFGTTTKRTTTTKPTYRSTTTKPSYRTTTTYSKRTHKAA